MDSLNFNSVENLPGLNDKEVFFAGKAYFSLVFKGGVGCHRADDC